MGEFLLSIWTYFATNILTQPAYLIGFIVLLGYILLKRPLHECIAGFLKATVGYFILTVGSGGLVNNFRPILVGLKERFNLDAMTKCCGCWINGDIWPYLWRCDDSITDCVCFKYFISPFSEIYETAIRFHDRKCSGPASSYRFLDFTVLLS